MVGGQEKMELPYVLLVHETVSVMCVKKGLDDVELRSRVRLDGLLVKVLSY